MSCTRDILKRKLQVERLKYGSSVWKCVVEDNVFKLNVVVEQVEKG